MKLFQFILRLLLVWFVACPALFAAITERYVSSTGTDTYANSTNPATPMSFATAIANAAAGDRINIKADGTYARTTSNDIPTNSGTATSPIIYRGYSSTIGDGYQGRTAGGGLVTTNMPSITYTSGLFNSSGTMTIYESLQISGTRNGLQIQTGNHTAFKSCKLSDATTGSSGCVYQANGNNITLFDCDIILSNGGNAGDSAIILATNESNVHVIACRITSTGVGIKINGGTSGYAIANNTIYASTGNGIAITNTAVSGYIGFNTIPTGGADGINVVTGSTVMHTFVGNMITDNTGDGIDMVSTANAAFVAYLRTRDNANSIANGGDWITATNYGVVTTDTGGASTDYVNAGSNDYRLIAASPATSAAQPASASIGALQRDQTGSGSGGQKSYSF